MSTTANGQCYKLAPSYFDSQLSHLHVLLDIWVIETSTNESLGVEDGVSGVHGGLVLGGISDQSLTLGESDVRRGGSVTLVWIISVLLKFDVKINVPLAMIYIVSCQFICIVSSY